MPKERRPTLLHAMRLRVLALVLLCAPVLALALGDLSGTPYSTVVGELLEHLHAVQVPCTAMDGGVLCFEVEPAQVAGLAEAIETFLVERQATLRRDDWQSANGVHTVTLILRDDPWGGLRLWLSEPGPVRVEGRMEYLARRR